MPLVLISQDEKYFYTFNSGINYTALTIRNSGQLTVTNTRAPGYRFGGYCGISYNRKLSNKWDLSLGLELSHQSWVSNFSYGSNNQPSPNTNVVLSHLPVKFYFKAYPDSKARIFAGFQTSLLLYEYYAESDRYMSKPFTESNFGETNRLHMYYLLGTDYKISAQYTLEFGFAGMPMNFSKVDFISPSTYRINYFHVGFKYQIRKKNEK